MKIVPEIRENVKKTLKEAGARYDGIISKYRKKRTAAVNKQGRNPAFRAGKVPYLVALVLRIKKAGACTDTKIFLGFKVCFYCMILFLFNFLPAHGPNFQTKPAGFDLTGREAFPSPGFARALPKIRR